MELQLGDVQETALIPLAVRANETKRENARIHDGKAVEIIETLGIDTKKYTLVGKIGSVIAKNLNNRLAVYRWRK